MDYVKMVMQYVLPKKWLSMLAGCLAQVEQPAVKNYLIRWFINQYQVNMQEASRARPEDYRHFNDFFIRHLQQGARVIEHADVISPVDGCISEMGRIENGQMLQAKGRLYRVDDLLAADSAHVSSFHHGSFMTLYLSPKDYHRVHMPMDAVLKEVVYVPGALFSVQPATTRMIPKLFARNERLVAFFETHAGRMAMVLVGATIVGAIGTSWQGEILRQKTQKKWMYDEHQTDTNTLFKQADEMGYFKLGSTVILLFEDTVPLQWAAPLQAGSAIKMGQKIASLV